MSEQSTEHVDIAVIGGGLAGIAAAHVATSSGFSTVHVAPSGAPDARTSALMMPSVKFMQDVGLIGEPSSLGTPLAQIRIIDATNRMLRAPETLFTAQEFNLDAFGWNFANTALSAAFRKSTPDGATLQIRNTTLSAAQRTDGIWHLKLKDGTTLSTELVIGADGKQSKTRQIAGIATREHSYAQSALVCDLALERPIGNCSIEFHYPNGPFTLVPAAGDKANLVWIDTKENLLAAQADPERFQSALFEKSQRLFGAIEPLTKSHVFPLSALSVAKAGNNGIVLVGESAHAFPPIGAQGLNLGLRDVADLAACLALVNRQSYGWADRLVAQYAETRAHDLMRTGHFVDGLFKSLLSDLLPAQALRSVGLWALKSFKPLRKFAIEFGMGRN